MRLATVTVVICAVLLTASCEDATAPVRPPGSNEPIARVETGRLVVRVVWDGQGVPDKRVEVLELHLTGTTDAQGYATFDLRAGEYTLRAYDINRGGPAMLYIDTKVTIVAGKEVRIEVLDCLPCV
jgi:predicted phage tail protein